MTFESRRQHRRPKRGPWDHINTPDGLRRRSATRDADREALCATLPPMDCGPAPGSQWVTVQVVGAAGALLTVDLHVPMTRGARCDQHAAVVNGKPAPRMLTATGLGKLVAAAIPKRPNVEQLEEARRQ